jgi:hypothetical protein
MLVNNTNADVRDYEDAIIQRVREGKPLPDELEDIFNLKIIQVNGENRGILNWA